MNPVINSDWSVYLLFSKKDKKWYIGCTNDIKNRINQHNDGKVSSTKSRLPLILIYFEVCVNKKDAYAREKYLKSGMGKKYLKNRLKNYFLNFNKVNL